MPAPCANKGASRNKSPIEKKSRLFFFLSTCQTSHHEEPKVILPQPVFLFQKSAATAGLAKTLNKIYKT